LCGTELKITTGVWYERQNLEDVGNDGRMILMNLTEIGWEVHLTEDGGQWQTLLNMVVYLQVLQNCANFLTKISVSWPNRTVLYGVK
jgi:hypothetical protein